MVIPPKPVELSPLDVVMLGLMLESKFCDRESYRPEICDRFCSVCQDLLIKEVPPCHDGSTF
jgi:hypothetical protein